MRRAPEVLLCHENASKKNQVTGYLGRMRWSKSLAGFATAVWALILAAPAISADLSFKVVDNETVISELDFEKAEVTVEVVRDPGTGFHGLNISLSADRVSQFESLTAANIGRQMRMVVDGIFVTDAWIREPISTGQMRVYPGISREELSKIAERLR